MARTESTMLELGTTAPDFSLTDYSGSKVCRDDFQGKEGLLVIFVCNHCPYVLHINHELAKFAREYQARGLGVVAISSNDVGNYPDDSPEKMVDIVKEYDYTFPYLYDETQEMLKVLHDTFELDICARFRIEQINDNLFKDGVYPAIDSIVKIQQKEVDKMEDVATHIESLFEKDKLFTGTAKYATVSYLESEGYFLNLTKNRFTLIEKSLKDSFVTIDNQHHFFKDFHYKYLKNAVKVQAPLFEEITRNYETSQIKLVSLVKQRYTESLDLLENRFSLLLDKLIVFIANIDVAISNAKCTKTMNLSRPIIEEGNFYEATALRHPIIESNDERGIYVPNDIFLGANNGTTHNHITLNASDGEDVLGTLLYGINSSGKSSLMKSIGTFSSPGTGRFFCTCGGTSFWAL